jgi:hypothetical protein
MLIGISGFGSVWRRRVEGGATDSSHVVRTAYFNTTGVMVNGKLIRHRKIAGHVRFNGAGGFNPNYPSRMIGKVFECDEPCVWNGQNKVFFRHIVHTPVEPDCFLVVVKSAEFGRFRVGTPGWKSEASFLISFSEWRDQQEALLVMPRGNLVRTSLGKVVLVRDSQVPWRARLRFEVTD